MSGEESGGALVDSGAKGGWRMGKEGEPPVVWMSNEEEEEGEEDEEEGSVATEEDVINKIARGRQ